MVHLNWGEVHTLPDHLTHLTVMPLYSAVALVPPGRSSGRCGGEGGAGGVAQSQRIESHHLLVVDCHEPVKYNGSLMHAASVHVAEKCFQKPDDSPALLVRQPLPEYEERFKPF